MGVPKFYRWISERYPLINQLISTSAVLPEFDHLYLDMNGILHACSHPNDDKLYSKLPEREIIWSIFRYLDRIISEIVKPKKLIYMAIDGVAPRAKLNQQRARRFRAAQDRQQEVENKAAKEFISDRGVIVSEPELNKDDIFDSNCITPGTEFMEKISSYIRWFIREKIKNDPLWRDLKIIFSGHDVPGEGEHKIMEFIRNYRNGPEYVPNTRHCMYGQDADLIMLGLATHETHFALLREVINFNTFSKKGQVREIVMRQSKEAQFQLLHISILREYLHLDFGSKCMQIVEGEEDKEIEEIDQERLIDDFIFLTFLVGNDFLPHLPTLDIGEHAFEFLFNIYCTLYRQSPGYITHNGQIGDFTRLENLFKLIGEREISILTDREKESKSFRERRRNFNNEGQNEIELALIEFEKQEEFEKARSLALGIDYYRRDLPGQVNVATPKDENAEEYEDGDALEDNYNNFSEAGLKELESLNANKDFHGRYYFEKFNIITDTLDGNKFLTTLTAEYLKGLQWCLAYYIRGCISWTWYYPYHYGPMLMDMKNLKTINNSIKFNLGQPFTPFQQLLGCLPPFSCNFLPLSYRWLMTSPESPIIDFYPEDFEIDMDGKKNPWEAVVCLDFIDENRLIAAEKQFCPPNCLNRVETLRNTFGNISLFEYDPSITSTYLSCSPENNIPDIINCYSRETPLPFSLEPGEIFAPKLMPGTIYPISGFPSLSILPITGIREHAAKINVFGSASKYKSLIISLNSNPINLPLEKLQSLIGKTVFVNYPQVHEGQVIGISTNEGEAKFIDTSSGLKLSTEDAIRQLDNSLKGIKISQAEIDGKGNHITKFNRDEAARWKANAIAEVTKYYTGRGTPGNCGIEIGDINVNLIVRPLQGLKRDYKTGKTVKIYANTLIASIPIQMALFTPPCIDLRFKETEELPLDVLYPVGSEVIAVDSDIIGCKGTVIATSKNAASRTIDVEFSIPIPESPFGYSLARSISDKYFSSNEICKLLKISGAVLGKIVGSIRLTPIRYDLGLNLKRNGMYQLLGYVRRVDPSNDYSTGDRKIWTGVESVNIVGVDSMDAQVAKQTGDLDATYWEYSAQAAALLFEYKERFPILFERLQKLPHSQQYMATELLGANATKVAELIDEWMKSCPFFTIPRTPLTTVSLNKDAMVAIEKAADMYHAKVISDKGMKKISIKNFPIDKIYTNIHRTVHDVSLSFNLLEPRLGDRVVNLCATGVPFGLRGTVVTIHKQTQYVEVIFDEEFVGGRNLQGNCSQFRGRLCSWADLILVSGKMDYRNPQKIESNVEEDNKILGKIHSAVITKNNPPAPSTIESSKKTMALKNLLTKKDVPAATTTPVPAPVPVPVPTPMIVPPVPPLPEALPPSPDSIPLPKMNETTIEVKIIEDKKFQDDDEDDFHAKLHNKIDISSLTSDGSGYKNLLSLGGDLKSFEEIESKKVDPTQLFGSNALIAEAYFKNQMNLINNEETQTPPPPVKVQENNNKPKLTKVNLDSFKNQKKDNTQQKKIPTTLKESNLEVKKEIKSSGLPPFKILTKSKPANKD